MFTNGDRVDVIGVSRGKGFQGVMKRHNFRGGAATHGSMFHRAPGSIGASSFPSRVVKGMRAAGRMGGDRVTTRNLKVVAVDAENNLLIVHGAVPGAPGSYVVVRKAIAREARAAEAGREAGQDGREEAGEEVAPVSWQLETCDMKINIVNANNETVGDLELNDELFGGRVKTRPDLGVGGAAERGGAPRHARDQDPRAWSAARGKKPWRQKGTGRARVGEIRNPLWRKGGTVFGPQPRSYEFDLPKKVRRGALRAALAQKMQDGALVVVDKLEAAENEDQGDRRAAEAARRDRQDAGHRRDAAGRLRADARATSPGCRSWPATASPRAT